MNGCLKIVRSYSLEEYSSTSYFVIYWKHCFRSKMDPIYSKLSTSYTFYNIRDHAGGGAGGL